MDLSAAPACKKIIILPPSLPSPDSFPHFPNTVSHQELFQLLPLQVDKHLACGKAPHRGNGNTAKECMGQDSQKVILHFQAWKKP